jgi:hypothetical protein
LGQVERGVSRLVPKRWTVDRLARAATRLMGTFERRTEVAEDVIDAVEVLREHRDILQLHYLTPEAAHEASQGAYMQAAHLEWQANNNPDPHRRAELIRRARTALAAGDKLRGL